MGNQSSCCNSSNSIVKATTDPILSRDGKTVIVNAGTTIGSLVQFFVQEKKWLKSNAIPPGDDKKNVLDALVSGHAIAKDVKKITYYSAESGNNMKSCLCFSDLPEGAAVSSILFRVKKEVPGEGTVGSFYLRPSRIRALSSDVLPPLPESASLLFFKAGRCTDFSCVIRVDDSTELDAMMLENFGCEVWEVRETTTKYEQWKLWSDVSCFIGLDTLTTKHEFESDSDEAFNFVNLIKGQVLFEKKIEKKNELTYVYTAAESAEGAKKSVPMEATPQQFKLQSPAAQNDLTMDENIHIMNDLKSCCTEVYSSNDVEFASKRIQYATTSFDKLMKPRFIAYPRSEKEVVSLVTYAKKKGGDWHLMTRSGGHQYCGVSADNGTLVMSMEHFNQIEVCQIGRKTVKGPDGNDRIVTVEARVGVGCRLQAIATTFHKNGVTIPHGECPTVGIGGHVQTGGYGHLARSFGLCHDYLYEFTIVTADGKVRHPNRDSTGDDRDLFWAVCGGSPGAFGVVTEYIFHPILDTDYPYSTGFQAEVIYDQDLSREMISILMEFTNRSMEGDDKPLADIDLMMSLASHNQNGGSILARVQPSVILFEMVCKNSQDTDAFEQFTGFVNRFKAAAHRLELEKRVFTKYHLDGKSHYALSFMSLAFTRTVPAVVGKTVDGFVGARENPYPYDKATYGARNPLETGFVDTFSSLLHDLTTDKNNVHMIFQVVIGGGAQAQNSKSGLSALAHRETCRLAIVFDLFRPEEEAPIQAASEYQRRFLTEVVEKYMAHDPKIMMQWATHGDLDLKNDEVWEMYFDKKDDYYRLREIKSRVDSNNLFRSRFTIPPSTES